MNHTLLAKKMPTLIAILLCFSILICAFVFVYLIEDANYDAVGHWRICKYTIEGYNPYLLVGESPAIESVGKIPGGFSTMPWGCLLGSFFYAGFLPLDWAVVYIFALHILALAAMTYVLFKKYGHIFPHKSAFFLLLLPLSHFSFMYSVLMGNAGGIICPLLIISILISDDHPYWAGSLLALTMAKPQISAIFCLLFLIKKQWKVLFTAAFIVLSGWVATSIVTSTDPVTLLSDALAKGTASDAQYLGLLNNLKYIGVNSTVILLLNMAIGAAFILVLSRYLRKNHLDISTSAFYFVPVCIASTFWVYKNGTDYMILIFATLMFFILCFKHTLTTADYLGSFVSIGYLQMSRCFVYVGKILFRDNLFISDLFKSVDGLVLALIGIYLCRLWVKYKGESNFIKLSE